jgi:hypothetical protein
VVILPPEGFAAGLPAGAGILAAGPFHLTVRTTGPGLARALYAAGARLVLPAGLAGCLPLPRRGSQPGDLVTEG